MMLPTPVVGVVGNLVRGVDGGVWACYQVDPFGYPHRSLRDATQIHARTVGALLALPERSLILSTVDQLTPGEIETRIASAASEEPGWWGSARRSGEQIVGDGVFERRWFLSFRLPANNGSRELVDRLRTAAGNVGGGFGLPAPPPTTRRTAAAKDAASVISEQVGQHLRVRPLSARQVRWLYQRAVLRGINTLRYPEEDRRERVSVVRLDHDTVYFEGGRKYDPGRPRHWRYLTVEHPDHGVGFQSFSCLGEMPVSWTHPYGSGEWLWHLDDQLPFGVDWAVRIERVENQTAQRRALRAKRNLVGQLTEPGGDPAGPATTLASATESVDGLRSVLESNPALPAFRATTIAAVASRDLKTLDARVGVLESVFAAAEYNFYRPTGDQLACFTAMFPGAPDLAVVSEYAQDLLPEGLASAAPFAAAGVGDPTGTLLAVGLDTQYQTPVFWNPGRGPKELNRSGSLAAVGELGAGKSFLAKTLAVGALGMGGQVVAVDRTERGEYAALADIVAGTSQVVELSADAEVYLDPFRVFPTDELRTRYGVGFISLLTATPPGSSAGAHIYRAAQQTLDQAAARGIPARLADVIPHLHAVDSAAGEVADKLEALSQIAYGKLVFSEDAESLDLSADYVCFHIPGLRLPRRNTSREDLLAEELMGQSVLYLVAAFARRILFSTPDRFTALLLDEAHALTANPQGRALIGELIRDGRKHHAAVWAFTQLPGDITTTDDEGEMVEGLLGYRIVFRQSPHTAPQALSFLGSDDRQENLDTVTALKTGECLIRDLEGRIGLVRVLPPDDPDVQAAYDTTPTRTVVTDLWPSLNHHHPQQTVNQP